MSRFGSRLIAAAIVMAIGMLVGPARPASAHALRQSSYPDAGATLPKAPTEVRVTFGEQPDPKLSSLRVLDTSGRDHATGTTAAVPGQPLTLRRSVEPLANGVYTVSWRTVSKVDGHLATGTFAFGVGVSPTGAAASGAAARSPSPSTANLLSRWLLYVGLMVLLGASVVILATTGVPTSRLWLLLALGVLSAAAGALGIGLDQLHNAGLPVSKLFDSPFGHPTILRLAPVAVAAVALVAAIARSGRIRAMAVGVIGAAGAAAMWGDVEASHAAASGSFRLARMALQWLHFAAAGIWVGGLLAILVVVRVLEPERRPAVVRRYSAMALGAVAVIGLTGVLRAFDEVHGWHRLVSTTFGRYVLLKSLLLVALIGLGAVNRYRSVPVVARTLRPLRGVGRAELAVVAVVLVAAAMLQGLAPPASVAKAATVHPIVVTGADFATTVRVRLSVSPGIAGFNTFRLTITDYDSGQPVDAQAVSLRFALPARPDVGESTLGLTRTAPGTYSAPGANLSIDGTWTVTVLVQRANGGVEIPLRVTTRQPPQRIEIQRTKGLPTVYVLHLSDGRSLQVYVDPGKAGAPINELHATFFAPDGNELPVDSVSVAATGPGTHTARPLTTRRLDPLGHFVSDLLDAGAGTWTFDVTATLPTGEQVQGHFAIPIP
ncbi:MAG: copper resistance protein CopC [Acidimicrobiales bacterium]|jgi:copper transport protein|nr:copper resistance protein CopC [Acidimicrobiales bacterium]